MNKTEEYCKKATQDEILGLFNTLSKSLVKQFKIKENSSLKELRTNFKNKKQHDSFYNHSELIAIMRQIAQIVSFTVRPWTKPKTMLRCHVEHLDVNKMVVVYEC